MTQTLMVQGTSSDSGKSTIVGALCRLAHRQGKRVAPFKPQNMSLNSAVTCDLGEIGRAQAWQALAAGIAPETDMNPILLKPNTDTGSQIIIQGRSIGNLDALAYHAFKPKAMEAVLQSYHRLREKSDLIVVEGAGSPAEVNLREGDIANMGFAEAVDCPVLLVADIDRGGVFAQVLGTLACLSDAERARVKGIIINKFRGDVRLLQNGIAWVEAQSGKPVLGVVPFVPGLWLDAEDMLPTTRTPVSKHGQTLRVVVPALPRLSNHTDFDSLQAHPQVHLTFWRPGQELVPSDLIVLPGSKSVSSDLLWLRAHGWEDHINTHLRYGGKAIGICGGLQMLGREIHDPHCIESANIVMKGFGLLDYTTTLERTKQLRQVHGRLNVGSNGSVKGYEIHMGCSSGPAMQNHAMTLAIDGGETMPDGAVSSDARILATYLHGLFDTPEACETLLKWAGLSSVNRYDHDAKRLDSIEKLADVVGESIDIQRVWDLAR